MQVWVLTGDKTETAVNIAYACKLLDHKDLVFTLNTNNKVLCAPARVVRNSHEREREREREKRGEERKSRKPNKKRKENEEKDFRLG